MKSTLKMDVLPRIEKLTDELQNLRADLANNIFDPRAPGENPPLRSPEGELVLKHFRAAIDDVRHLLWVYEGTRTIESEKELRQRLLKRATEILSALSITPPLPRHHGVEDESFFVHRLLKLIECRVVPKESPKT